MRKCGTVEIRLRQVFSSFSLQTTTKIVQRTVEPVFLVHLEDIGWLLAGNPAINDVLQKDLLGAALSPRRQWFGCLFCDRHSILDNKACFTGFQMPKDDDVINGSME
jgi:hypothetical protein